MIIDDSWWKEFDDRNLRMLSLIFGTLMELKNDLDLDGELEMEFSPDALLSAAVELVKHNWKMQGDEE